ncbi:MAG TPA: hypothetical protein VF651_11515 [Gammaproteobacteria bacterium]
MDAHGNVVVADSGANLSTHYSYDPATRYMILFVFESALKAT